MQNLLRSNEAEVQTIDLNDVACVVHEILKPHAAEVGVEMKTHHWQSVLAVRADPAWLQQVVLNLAFNAMEAMSGNLPGQRRIVIETHQVGQSKAGLSVSDTGTGIPAHQLARIFEPFASKRGLKATAGQGWYGHYLRLHGLVCCDQRTRAGGWCVSFGGIDSAQSRAKVRSTVLRSLSWAL